MAPKGKHSSHRTVRVLALDLPEAASPGVLAFARSAGWVVSATRYMGGSPRTLAHWWGADGILVGGKPFEHALAREWKSTRLPIVHITDWGPALGKPTVLPDWRAAGQLAARHFIERGFRQLAYCHMGGLAWPQLAGFREAVGDAGAVLHVLHWTDECLARYGPGPRGQRRWLGRALAQLPAPVGLLVDDDWTALEAVEGCLDAGLAVPDRVAVVGIGNALAVCENARVPLSSVELDPDRLGREAAGLLDRLMRGRRAPAGPVLIPPRGVVVRRSSDILAAEHPEVAKALRHIWDHYRDPQLDVPRIVAATALSKTALNLAFRRCLNRTVGRLLLELRLRHARDFLAAGHQKVRLIARECGFRDANYLRAALRRETGLGPRAWRRLHHRDTP